VLALVNRVYIRAESIEAQVITRTSSSSRQLVDENGRRIVASKTEMKKHTVWRALDWVSKLLTRTAAALVQD
jgi:hypothetical protein